MRGLRASVRRGLAGGAVAALLAAVHLVGAQGASADGCWVFDPVSNSMTYTCQETTPGGPGNPGTGDGGETDGGPTCDLTSPATFCVGTTACYIKDVVTPFAPPSTPPPHEGAEWQVRMCRSGPFGGLFTGEPFWVDAPTEPPLIEQAREAVGRIVLPTYSLGVSPEGRSYVQIDTWFWAEGGSDAQATGSSAFGLVAYATPDRLLVDPGDGSGTRSCAWTVAAGAACSVEYDRSSARGSATGPSGQPAFTATGQGVWSVHFERDGAVIDVPGAPAQLEGPVVTSTVEVAEVQVIITGN